MAVLAMLRQGVCSPFGTTGRDMWPSGLAKDSASPLLTTSAGMRNKLESPLCVSGDSDPWAARLHPVQRRLQTASRSVMTLNPTVLTPSSARFMRASDQRLSHQYLTNHSGFSTSYSIERRAV